MWDTMAPWLIGLALLFAVIFFMFILKDKGENLLDFVRRIFSSR